MPLNPKTEKNLSDLALSKISDSVPDLIAFWQGTELVESNDDGSRAAAIMGFDLNGTEVRVPILFLSGQIKGSEIGYLPESDTFFSLTRPWVKWLASRSTGVTGQGDPAGHNLPQVPSSSLRLFSRLPMISNKRASADVDAMITEWIDPARALAIAPRGLSDFLAGMTKKAYLSLMEELVTEHPKLMSKMANLYGGLDSLKVAEFKAEGPCCKDCSGAPKCDCKCHKEKKVAELQFIIPETLEKTAGLTLEQKEETLGNDLLVIDKRASADKSKVFDSDYRTRFSTPVESGFYDMINQYGEMKEVFIAHNAFVPAHPEVSVPGCIIVDVSSKQFFVPLLGDEVLCRPRKQLEDEDFKKGLGGMSSPDSMTPWNTYMLIGENGAVSAPFEVTGKTETPEYKSVDVTLLWDCRDKIRNVINDFFNGGSNGTLRLIDAEGTRIGTLGDLTLIPKGFKVIKLSRGDSKDAKKLKPGNHNSLDEAVRAQNLNKLALTKQGSKYVIRVGDKRHGTTSTLLTKRAAVMTLVGSLGLDSAEAVQLVENTTSTANTVWIKQASPIYSGMPFPDTNAVSGTNEFGLPEQWDLQTSDAIPMNNPEYPDVENHDLANWSKIKNSDADFLSRAADSGSQQVFDPAMIGAILKTNRTQSQVDNWTPDLVGAEDKLSRLLLLFYWKNSEFAKLYGRDEMSEFEDILLNTIKNMGTVVLFLKQRSGESDDRGIDALNGQQ